MARKSLTFDLSHVYVFFPDVWLFTTNRIELMVDDWSPQVD